MRSFILNVFPSLKNQPTANKRHNEDNEEKIMRDMTLKAILSESMSDEAAYSLVHFIGNLACALECIYYDQIQRYHQKVEENFYDSVARLKIEGFNKE